MITAEKIFRCAYLSSAQLEELLRVDYPQDIVLTSKFLGITNGEEFCYFITFPDDGSKSGIGNSKIFVKTDSNNNLICDY